MQENYFELILILLNERNFENSWLFFTLRKLLTMVRFLIIVYEFRGKIYKYDFNQR